MRTSRLAPLLLVLAAIPGCSLGDEPSTPPQLGPSSGDEEAAAKLGFPASATKNTTPRGRRRPGGRRRGRGQRRLPRHLRRHPARPPWCWWTPRTGRPPSRPRCSPPAPIGAPLLLSDGDELPAVTADTLERLKPKGSDLSKDAQVIRIGDAPARPDGLKAAVIEGKDPYARAAAIDRFFSAARGRPVART